MHGSRWRQWFRGALVGLVLFGLQPLGEHVGAAQRFQSASVMRAAAAAYLAALTPEQRAEGSFAFGDAERMNWHFIPRPRKGLSFKRMDPVQQRLAHAFLAAGLSQRGYIKAATIMSLEGVLKELERDTTGRRDAELYFVSLFGEPSDSVTWGWRVEGHHLSLNFTLAEGQLVASTPSFFGSNPAEVREGPRRGLRTLAGEEDRARDQHGALDAAQRKTAVTAADAPKDILSAASRRADVGPPVGLAAAKMTRKQVDLLLALLEEYAGNMPPDVAAARLDQVKRAGIEKVHFAWAGGLERGQPHYYRVQGPTFLVEYDNTQNDANHVHAVWRNFDGDFGLDLLGMHLREAPASHGHKH